MQGMLQKNKREKKLLTDFTYRRPSLRRKKQMIKYSTARGLYERDQPKAKEFKCNERGLPTVTRRLKKLLKG